jgi:hypothetical protein
MMPWMRDEFAVLIKELLADPDGYGILLPGAQLEIWCVNGEPDIEVNRQFAILH